MEGDRVGFSVSGSAALAVLGLLIVFSMVITTTVNGVEQIEDAREIDAEELRTQQNAAIEVSRVTLEVNTLHIYVNNSGAATLSVSDTDVIVDGEYFTPDATHVRHDPDTELWAPGEQIHIAVADEQFRSSTPSRLLIVTENGVSDREVLSL